MKHYIYLKRIYLEVLIVVSEGKNISTFELSIYCSIKIEYSPLRRYWHLNFY